MKYGDLIQICKNLKQYKKLKHIKRVDDNLFKVELDKEIFFFDLNKTNSNIHKNENFKESKIYKAPFDIILQKRFSNSNILDIFVPENNRVLVIKTSLNSVYKTLISYIYFEFTGRFTNVIITDEKDIIQQALRHTISPRSIQINEKFIPLSPIDIKEKPARMIDDFDEFYKKEFDKLNANKINELKSNKLTQIDKKISSLKDILSNSLSVEELMDKSNHFKKLGDVIILNLYKIKDYEREFALFDNDGNRFEYKLEKNAKISANEFFKESKKLRQKAKNSHIQICNIKEKIEFLSNLKTMIKNSDDINTINVLLPKKSNNISKINNDLIQNFYIKDFKISVGKNEAGNEYLLKNSSKNDLWFHLKDRPSAHIIIKSNKLNIDDDIIKFAGDLCVNFSVKNSGKYEVDYAKRKDVKVISKAFVNYVNFKTLIIDYKG